jgi:nucleoid-associated protein YgaU
MARTRVRWGRLGALVATAALTVSVAGGVARAGNVDSGGPFPGAESVSVRSYVVRPGDTVWAIARRVAGPQADPRPVVDRILRSNRLDPGSLQVGQTILIPSL